MLIKQGRLIDPSNDIDGIYDILIEDGRVKSIDKNIDYSGDIINAQGLIVSPGFVDIHVHFRDPGFLEKEDLFSGSKAAAHGGYTTVVCMANTRPAMDNLETLDYFLDKAAQCPINVLTISALTKGLKGEELVDMEAMIENGAVGFSDDGIPNTNTKLLLEAMNRARDLGVPISFHEEDPNLNVENGINHGRISEKLGLYGSPSISEDIYVARDCAMAMETGAKIDIQHISSGKSVDIIRKFKELGVKVEAEVTPHHFSKTEDLLLEKSTLAKVNPPLRTEEDRQKILDGIKDGTISIIATDHAPHTSEEKAKPLVEAPSGMIGLETSLSLGISYLVKPGIISINDLIKKMSTNPASFYGLEAGSLSVGNRADIVIFDMDEKMVYKEFLSKSSNSPFIGEELSGKVLYTISNGEVIYKE